MAESDAARVMRRMVAAFATGDRRDCHEYVSASYVDHQGRGGAPSVAQRDSRKSFVLHIVVPPLNSRSKISSRMKRAPWLASAGDSLPRASRSQQSARQSKSSALSVASRWSTGERSHGHARFLMRRCNTPLQPSSDTLVPFGTLVSLGRDGNYPFVRSAPVL